MTAERPAPRTIKYPDSLVREMRALRDTGATIDRVFVELGAPAGCSYDYVRRVLQGVVRKGI